MENNNHVENRILNISILPILVELDDILVDISYAQYEFLNENRAYIEPLINLETNISKKKFNERKYRNFYDWLVGTNQIMKTKSANMASAILIHLYKTLSAIFYDSKEPLFRSLTPNEFSNKIFNNEIIQTQNSFKNMVIIIRDNKNTKENSEKIRFIKKFYKSINPNISYVVLENSENLYEEILKKYPNFGLFITDDIELITKLTVNSNEKHEFLLPERNYNRCPKLLKNVMIEKKDTITYF